MNINYNLSPKDQAEYLCKTFLKCIVHHKRTNETDILNASTFTDEERIVINVIDLLTNDNNRFYWESVSKCIENR